MASNKAALARASEQQNSKDRWTLKDNLESLYALGEGSLYTSENAPNVPTSSKAPPLNKQIESGVKFFGYGRGTNLKRLGTQGMKEEGEIRVGGMLSTENQPTKTGDIAKLGGFNTYRAPRSAESDYGKNLLKTRDSSWFTKGVTDGSKAKYGYDTMKDASGGRGGSTRGRTDSGKASGATSSDSGKGGVKG